MRAIIFHTKAEVHSIVLQMNDLGSWEGHRVHVPQMACPLG